MKAEQIKAMIRSLHNTRDQYGRLAYKAEQSRIEQRNEGSSERDRCEMGQTMCTILIEAYGAALAITDTPPQTKAQPFAWYWHDQHGCLYITGDDRKPEVPTCAKPLYEHPPQEQMVGPADQIISQIEELFPNWRAYRDLVDCITCELHELRQRAGDRP